MPIIPAPSAVRGPPPRNAKALGEARARGELGAGLFVASFVGPTRLAAPHVFVDPGKRYDWRDASGMHAIVAVRPGINARQILQDLAAITLPYLTLVDFDRQTVGSVVDKPGGGFKLWPRRRGSPAWLEVFG